jgi:hypothetical protein
MWEVQFLFAMNLLSFAFKKKKKNLKEHLSPNMNHAFSNPRSAVLKYTPQFSIPFSTSENEMHTTYFNLFFVSKVFF